MDNTDSSRGSDCLLHGPGPSQFPPWRAGPGRAAPPLWAGPEGALSGPSGASSLISCSVICTAQNPGASSAQKIRTAIGVQRLPRRPPQPDVRAAGSWQPSATGLSGDPRFRLCQGAERGSPNRQKRADPPCITGGRSWSPREGENK